MADSPDSRANDFIRAEIEADRSNGTFGDVVRTRFPPEPNGFLHIGHAKAIILNFGIALESGGTCNLRFDDTNPTKEEAHYVESMRNDIRWLGFDWGEGEHFASDYFDQLYEFAMRLVESGDAYVDDLTAEEIRAHRGTLTEPGTNSPYRDRSVTENRKLFEAMRSGEFAEGSSVLRAKINMASPNINLRDPVMYRMLQTRHHRTGEAWSIYPMYDWAHGQSDSIEGITHSLCDLDFEDHRPLYDWFLDRLGIHHPRQIEFARLNITHTVLSKRRLGRLVDGGLVSGWDDPRMPTLAGLRRRGYTAESIRQFIERVGVSKSHSTVDYAFLEYFIREELNATARRVMVVLDPVKLIIDNYPAEQREMLEGENNPEDTDAGTRQIPISHELFIERSDFREEAPSKYFRLAPGREVRLKHGYYVTCVGYDKNEAGVVTEIHCTYDSATRGGRSADGRKVKGTLHWVSCLEAIRVEVRLYDHLFEEENPAEAPVDGEHSEMVSPSSLRVLTGCFAEPSLIGAESGDRFQFLRNGYFVVDAKEGDSFVFNRIVSLRDSWAKIEKKMKPD